MQNYITRTIEPVLLKATRSFPSLILTGPRQSGKTTLFKHLFPKYRFVSLDDPQLKLQANNDPRLFLENFPPPVIIDEIQYAPGLFPYLKLAIDAKRDKAGQFLLTGSQLFPLMAGVAESLAGRIAVFNLLPLSLTEKFTAQPNLSQLKQFFFTGGFPQLNTLAAPDRQIWFSSYLQTYLERDIRQLKQVSDLTDFQRFFQLIAANNGQLLNLSSLANDLGVAVNTIKSWLSLLEASGQIVLIKPYYRNRGKRLVKSPKLYFLDSGLFSHMIGLASPDQVFSGPLSGSHLETLVVQEIYKLFYSRGLTPKVYFWRTSNQQEVDLIVESGGKIVPIEIKLTTRADSAMATSLTSFLDLFKLNQGFIINLTNEKVRITEKVSTLLIMDLAKKIK